MAAELPLPKRVFAHGWWTNEGQKISKSLGNVIDPLRLVDEFGCDQTRYFLLREVPFGRDGDFVRSSFIQRINSDLTNDLGNLSQRTLSFVFKNLEGILPAVPKSLQHEDEKLLVAADGLLDTVRTSFDQQAFHDGLKQIWEVVAAANRYIDQMAPWALRKTDPNRMADVLGVLLETIRQVAILLQPIMPNSAEQLLDQLMVKSDERNFDRLGGADRLIAGRKIDRPSGVFPRFIEDEAP